MITITDYGVKLVQLTEDKIELVRQWRNSDKIKKYMEYRALYNARDAAKVV